MSLVRLRTTLAQALINMSRDMLEDQLLDDIKTLWRVTAHLVGGRRMVSEDEDTQEDLAHTRIDVTDVNNIRGILEGNYGKKNIPPRPEDLVLAVRTLGYTADWLGQLSDRMPNLTPSGEPPRRPE
jgi:hypothetical protein